MARRGSPTNDASKRSAGPRASNGAAGKDPKPWFQRVNGLVALPGVLRDHGIDPARALASVGLAPTALDRSDNTVSFPQAVQLMNVAMRESGCRHLGLTVGACWRLEHMGKIGGVMSRSPTVGSALQTYVVHQRQDTQGVAAWLSEYTATAEFGFATFHPNVEQVSVVYDLVLAALVSIMDELCARQWSPIEVHLPHARPGDDHPFRRAFRCKVTFDSDRAAVRFPRNILGWPVRAAQTSNPPSEAAVVGRHGDDLLPHLYRTLRVAILNGEPEVTALASELGVPVRTLNRRLNAHAMTFRQVLSDIRFEIARSMLRDSRISIGDIATILRYSDRTAFIRAFRRWAGTSPGQWRVDHTRSPGTTDGSDTRT